MSQAPKLTYFDSCFRFKDKRFHAFLLKNRVLLQGMVGALALAVAVIGLATGGATAGAPRAREVMRVALLKDPELRARIEKPLPMPVAQPALTSRKPNRERNDSRFINNTCLFSFFA